MMVNMGNVQDTYVDLMGTASPSYFVYVLAALAAPIVLCACCAGSLPIAAPKLKGGGPARAALSVLEGCAVLSLCIVLNTAAALGISLYSVHVQFHGLLAGLVCGVALSLAAVAHSFRARDTGDSDTVDHHNKSSGSGSSRSSSSGGGGSNGGGDDDIMYRRMSVDDHHYHHHHHNNNNNSGDKDEGEEIGTPSVRSRALHEVLEDTPAGQWRGKTYKHHEEYIGESRRDNFLVSYVASIQKGIERHTALFLAILLATLILTAMLYLLLFGACLCTSPVVLSTSLVRSFSGQTCPAMEICYTYLNLAEDPSTEVIVKFHTYDRPADESSSSYLLFGTSADSLDQRLNCTWSDFSPHTMDFFHGTKFVHTCEMTGLVPDTVYHFRPVLETTATASNMTRLEITTKGEPLKLKTLHNSATKSVRFVNGGDWGATPEAYQMLEIAIEQDPDFIAIGGDIAYENGFTTCYRRWDEILRNYSSMAVSSSGVLIPLLTCIGNHEAEWNRFGMMPWNAASYLHFFTHKIGIQSDDITGSNIGVFHVHNLAGHTLLVVLDSGVVMPHGAQNAFIEQQLKETKAANKIAMYHAPLYPSSRDFNSPPSARGREMWEGLFNEHGLQVALEHHDHAFKRTKQIRAGQVVSSGGTVYLGDGLMGVKPRAVQSDRDYLEKSDSRRHVWLVECSAEGASFTAIDDQREVFDTLVI